MKERIRLIMGILSLFLVVPPVIHFWVTTPSPFGFISIEKQDVWINFYSALIGGALTLIGVAWTIRYTENTRKEDLRQQKQDQVEEFERRNFETKINLAAQYKPILSVVLDTDYSIVKYGVSKYDDFYINNILSLNDKVEIQHDEKRISISLLLLNIGRGEANNLKISSLIFCPDGSDWRTEVRGYKELYTSNGLNLLFYKKLTLDEWKFYDNNILNEPMNICLKIEYQDLVGFKHTLDCVVNIQRFIYMRDEKNQILENVLVLNPYDTTIENMTSTQG